MIKVVTIVGARPQFIKAGSVSRVFAQCEKVEEVIVHTGQHYDLNMSDVFFEEMRIPKPHYFLGIGGISHGAMTGKMIEKIESVLLKEKPDWLLVYGDTNSTLAGAVAASKLNIKIAHIEAGLRSFNMTMPEEINRILTDRISSLLFCPTNTALENLHNEGLASWNAKAFVSGDVMQDGVQFYKKLALKPNGISGDSEFILATIHRPENTDAPQTLQNLVEAFNEISETETLIIPLHPRTKKKLAELDVKLNKSIQVLEPVGYLKMIWLLDNCKLVMTDSGGLQKEAFFFGKGCITLRNETEWVELVSNNFNVLVGADKERIVASCKKHNFSNQFSLNLYGKGVACKKILEVLLNE